MVVLKGGCVSAEFWEDLALADVDAMRADENYDGRYEDWYEDFNQLCSEEDRGVTVKNKPFKDDVPF